MSEKTTNIDEEKKELEERVKELEASLAEAKQKGAKVAVPIPGKYTVELETPGGKAVKRTIRFKAGRVLCAVPGVGKVPSEALMKLANGKKLAEEIYDEHPLLRQLDKQTAQDHLAWLASIEAGNIEDV